jgi:glycine cleavage system H protein
MSWEGFLWWREEGGLLLVGAERKFIQGMGEVLRVLLPAPGAPLDPGFPLVEVEVETPEGPWLWTPPSPFSGRVVEVNRALWERPELLREDPEGEGWLLRLSPGPG